METQQTTVQNETKTSLIARIHHQINEERVFKDIANLQMSRFLLWKGLVENLTIPEQKQEVCSILENNLRDNSQSIVSRYILGSLDLQSKQLDENGHITGILESFVSLSKWPIVDHLADLLLACQPNHRMALRAKVESVGNLRGKKESRSFLEKLAKIDRKNPDFAKKYGLTILEEDRKKALLYLKQAGETYARLKNYKSLEDIWTLIIQHDHKDLAFFERIERIAVGDRQKFWVASHLGYLIEPFRNEENWNQAIHLLKKVLHYEPHSSRARSDLIRAYRAKYSNHSLLNEFLKISELTNHKRSVGPCIASFERNIVFDVNNYVYHRTRDVGKIMEIDSDYVVIDFANNPGQKMSISMAIHSLQPLGAEHIWTIHYETPQEIEELFESDLKLFLELLLSSFNNRMSMNEIKSELVGRLLKASEWSKWWSRVRNLVKKDPKLGFNPHKKDELILREINMTLTEEISLRFQSESNWHKKMEIAFTSLKDPDTEGAAISASRFYRENETSKDPLKRLHSYLFLEHAEEAMGETISDRQIKPEDIEKLLKEESVEMLLKWSENTQSVELKKDLVELIIKHRPDYTIVLKGILFEVPIKIHRFIFSELLQRGQEETLKDYIEEIFQKYREHPEICLWIARSILTKQWENYTWLDTTQEEVLLLVFRLLKPLVFIEKKGNRLKNSALEIICGKTNITVESLKRHEVLIDILKKVKPEFLQRLYALFRDVPYIPEAHKENLLALMKELHPDLPFGGLEEELEEEIQEDALFPPTGVILSSAMALDKRRKYLDYLIHVEMPANSRDIGEAQEKGDLRENAEYKAAMERQSQIQTEISAISKELQKARAIHPKEIRTDIVSIGTRVRLKVEDIANQEEFTILGPWDTNTEQNIISYDSPLAKVLIGKKVGENALLAFTNSEKSYEICGIQSFFTP